MPGLPTGTVTFLFTDIEGSTTLLQRLGDRRYAEVLEEHRRLLRETFAEGHGQEIDTQGDAFLVVFPRARDALGAAVTAQRVLTQHTWPEGAALRVRMGLHTGEPVSRTSDYVGLDVHRAARICSAAHGGQILLSQAVGVLAAHDLPPGVSLRDLGALRLKDLKEPEHLFQVVHRDLPSDFSHLKSLDARPNNLAIQLTSFIGREREIAEVKRLLNTTRLLTLTGAGGSGKTRLALQVGADLLDKYADGVWFVELAPLSDPALVPKTVASALDVPEQPGRQLQETLADYLRPKHLLVLLDNCEHVLSVSQDLADGLLRGCPSLRVVATSREALQVEGELTYRVPSLQLPDLHNLPPLAQLGEYDAVRLFVERASFSQPRFELTEGNAPTVTQICQRLDGIPLAIEFAAARVKVLSVDQIAARLDDRFRLLTAGSRKTLPRHQTLRAMMDWSYDLLPEQERTVLRRLSVFAGGWTLEAAEAISSGEGVEAVDILDLLTQLVDKSLVVVETRGGEARYRLLETVRQYGRDRLQASGEPNDVRRRHRDWYLTLAEQADRKLHGPQQELWLERLEMEHDNMRVALEESKEEKDGAEAELRLAGALHWFWNMHGHWSEGRVWLEGALTHGTDVRPPTLAKALQGATHFALRQGDYGRAIALGQKGVALCRELRDGENGALLLLWLGSVATRQSDYVRATALFQESLSLCHELGEKWITALALEELGDVARCQGGYERAAALYMQSLALSRDAGDKDRIAISLDYLGMATLFQGDYRRAAEYFRESLGVCREVENKWVPVQCLEGLGGAAYAQQHYEKAARLFGAAEMLRATLGWYPYPTDQAYYDECAASTRRALGDAVFAAAWAAGRAMTLEQAIESAFSNS